MLKLFGVTKVGDAGQLVQNRLLACAQSSGPTMLRSRGGASGRAFCLCLNIPTRVKA
jgi:hypothetical protein